MREGKPGPWRREAPGQIAPDRGFFFSFLVLPEAFKALRSCKCGAQMDKAVAAA
jgi:hypothetical protein